MLAEVSPTVVNLTPSAIAQVKFLMNKKGNANLMLRIGVKGGGCSGLSYIMNLEEAATDRDNVHTVDGISIIVDKRAEPFLDGVELDYTIKNLLEGGWKWTNPNAQKSCGCGTSFTPK